MSATFDHRHLPERFRAARLAQRMSRRQVAQQLGCSESTVKLLEGGQREPLLTTAARFAALYGHPLGHFVERVGTDDDRDGDTSPNATAPVAVRKEA